MKKLFAFLSLFTCAHAAAQDSLHYFTDTRNRTIFTGMKVLGSWGAANLAGGGIGWAMAKGSNKYFYQMSTFWGAVNFGIATLGYTAARKKMNQSLTATESLKAQKKLENIFLINSGLDLVYTGAGLYMKTRGNNKHNETLQGYGSAVMLQGIFLLIFDSVMYKLERNNGNSLRKFLDKNSIAFSGSSIGISHRF